MVSLETIEREISELEARETTYKLCERLAWLYIVRDHLMQKYGMASVPSHLSGSEFLDACDGVDYARLMDVLDEHMTALSVVHPKEYESVMDRIKRLR